MIPQRRFGRTELAMPVLSCGGMRYQESWEDIDPAKITEANQRNLEETILRALELGINHIETARGYGTSELQLGRILPALPRESLIVQTKVSASVSGTEFSDLFNRSMANLQLQHVDLLSLHGINTAEILKNSLQPGGSLWKAKEFQRSGRARWIGFSTHGPLDTILGAIRSGHFDYVNLHWYWVNRRNWPAIEEARARDMGVFIISPNDKGGKLYEPPEKLMRLCAPLHPMAFNNLFCLGYPEVHTLSVGAARPSDFDAHTASLAFLGKSQHLVADISMRLEKAMDEALGAEWMRDWQTGIPEWDKCPGEVNVWEILRLWNFAKGLDMLAFARMRYNLLGQAEHWFPGKNAAEFEDSDMSQALQGSPFRDRIPGILREAHALFSDKPAKRLGRD